MTSVETTSPLTEYVVMSQTPSITNGASAIPGGLWKPIKTVSARSANEAIKQVADTKAEAVYVAVPARSFNPVKVTPKVETTLVLGEVKA